MARPRQVSDEDILATARALFVKHGPTLPTSVIADALGISQPALFKRFKSKDELMLEAMLHLEPNWEIVIGQRPDSRPLGRQLKEIAGRIARHLREIVPCAMVLRSSRIDPSILQHRFPLGPPPLIALRTLTAWLQGAQQQGLARRDFDVQATATMLLGALLFRTFLDHTMTGLPTGLGASDDPEHLGHIVDLVVEAIRPRDESES